MVVSLGLLLQNLNSGFILHEVLLLNFHLQLDPLDHLLQNFDFTGLVSQLLIEVSDSFLFELFESSPVYFVLSGQLFVFVVELRDVVQPAVQVFFFSFQLCVQNTHFFLQPFVSFYFAFEVSE
jgi:hypothetical protein